ncbi:MAG: family 10 glycosylhydrolase [Actinomycetota bacterium]|nr:family 10 glycosylhydrolase [Actinomycetota bacterium]
MEIDRKRLVWLLAAVVVASAFAVGLPARPTPPSSPVARGAPGQGPCTPEPATPKRQLRAMWIASVANIDWPSRPGLSAETVQTEYRAWLDLAQRHHHNAVVVQIRPTADAFWPSPYEPWSEWLTGHRDGGSPGWDPLAFLVAEAHQRNLEFHAWFNPYRVSMPGGAGPDIGKLAPHHPARQRPDWAVAYPINAPASRLYYNPGIPEVRRFVEDAILDAVAHYDIDGVHFDDYFYPYPAAGQDFADDATYARYGAEFTNKADWRRDNVNHLIQELGQRIKNLKPWVKFGVSPFAVWRNRSTDPLGSQTNGLQTSYDALYADTRLWVKQQWIDYIVPQVYWNIGFGPADYALLVPWWSDVVSGTRVQLYIGQADYKIGTTGAWLDPAEMSRHLAFNSDHPQVLGDMHFSAKDVLADPIGGVSRYVADHYTRPALVPRMAHLPSRPLRAPLVTAATRDAGTGAVALAWLPPNQSPPFGAATSYAIYRFDGPALPDPCRFADAAHLLTTQRATNGVRQTYIDSTAQPDRTYIYYLTALDRIWNESDPSPPAFIE